MLPLKLRFDDQTENLARQQDAKAYELRHERATLDLRPHGTEVFDYATAQLRIQRGAHHLDEALPSGQTERVRAAYLLLRQGCDELGVWLRSRGVNV